MSALCDLIGKLAAFFSHLDISVVSLRYSFAGIIIILGTAALFILLTVKLKHKVFVLIPPAATAICFCICFAAYNLTATHTNVIYTSTERGDILTVADRSCATLIDASNGSYATILDAYDEARELCVTEIESIILTDYYAKHIPTLDIKNTVIKDNLIGIYVKPPLLQHQERHVTDLAYVRSTDTIVVKKIANHRTYPLHRNRDITPAIKEGKLIIKVTQRRPHQQPPQERGIVIYPLL
jgi:hypothetical protein